MKEKNNKKQWSPPSVRQIADTTLSRDQLNELAAKDIIDHQGFVLDVERYNRHITIWQKTK